jgi:hypothetical protein
VTDRGWAHHGLWESLRTTVVPGRAVDPCKRPWRSVSSCGHEGTEKTLHRVRVDFFLPGARVAVREFVRAGVTC